VCVCVCVCVCLCVGRRKGETWRKRREREREREMKRREWGGGRRTWRVDATRPSASTGTSDPASADVSAGVMNGAARVDAVVIITLSATSAFAISVTRFDAVPPGQHATRMTPTARGGESPKIRPMARPRRGMMVNWQMNPRKTWGWEDSFRKPSEVESEKAKGGARQGRALHLVVRRILNRHSIHAFACVCVCVRESAFLLVQRVGACMGCACACAAWLLLGGAATCLGLSITRLKSSTSRVMPMKSIVMASATVILPALSHASAAGLVKPRHAAARTQAGNRLVRAAKILTTLASRPPEGPPPAEPGVSAEDRIGRLRPWDMDDAEPGRNSVDLRGGGGTRFRAVASGKE
jgi:hypothetical protein